MAALTPEELQDWIPKYLWQTINKVTGQKVTAEEWNDLWNLNIAQGDYNTDTILGIIQLLFATIEDVDADILDITAVADDANTKSDAATSTANAANTKATTALSQSGTALTQSSDALTKANTVYALYPALQQALLDIAAALDAINSKASITYVNQVAANFVLGKLSNGSVTYAMLATDV